MHAVAGDLRGTLLDYRKRHQAGHAGARNPCADCPPQAAALGPACYSGLSGAIGAGREKPRRRPFARLTRGGPATLPLCYPRLCLARSYRAHAGAFCGKTSSRPWPMDQLRGRCSLHKC
ncbi:hypothetical protein ANACOL_02384 [Anaerotruncus colihominis DSM 17241]|uniref:Uncharacterized protein n=1 Tax=Anaerotruncus colihominis DSM 17241 TaxID=445972 RepID=B0PC75_9FIRM|nr:hypothetical protein ANACOL_02384 [Anaerotruncus colihominis DSM 17241]